MINVSIKNNISLPNLNFQEDLVKVAKRIIIPELAAGIDRQESITGGSFPSLEPATVKYKSKNGLSEKILIAKGKLRRSFIYRKQGENTVIVYINDERKDIGKYLQVDGVGKKKKHFNFFGISKIMEANAIELMKNIIRGRISAKQ